MINLGTFKKAMILTFEPGGEEASVMLLNIWLEPQKILSKMRQAGAGGLTSLGSCTFPSIFFPPPPTLWCTSQIFRPGSLSPSLVSLDLQFHPTLTPKWPLPRARKSSEEKDNSMKSFGQPWSWSSSFERPPENRDKSCFDPDSWLGRRNYMFWPDHSD